MTDPWGPRIGKNNDSSSGLMQPAPQTKATAGSDGPGLPTCCDSADLRWRATAASGTSAASIKIHVEGSGTGEIVPVKG